MSATGWTTSNYYSRTGAVLTTPPITMACWFNIPNITTSGTLMGLGNDGGSGFFQVSAAGAVAGDPIRAQTQTDGGTASASDTGVGFSANVWNHAAGVFASTTSRTAYLNGTAATTDTTSVANPTPDFTSIGVLRRSTIAAACPSTTLIAEAAIWSAELSADDIASLAAGFSPRMVRADALVAYWPMVNADSPAPEFVGVQEMTMTGTITTGDHPRIIRPSDDHVIFVPSVAGGFKSAWARNSNSVIQFGGRGV